MVNIKFLPENLIINNEAVELPMEHPIYNLSRYNFEHYRPEFNDVELGTIDTIPDNKFKIRGSQKINLSEEDFSSKTFEIKPKQVEIEYLHKEISFKITKILQDKYGENAVGRENPGKNKHNRIDIVLEVDNEILFFEIKTYQSAQYCIREAIGQLLEYSYFSEENIAQKLIVVSPNKATIDIIKYITHLRKATQIPIYYQQFDIVTDQLMERI